MTESETLLCEEPIIPSDQYDLNRILVDQAGLRNFNPHRFEMEQLSAVVHEDRERQICVGYKDITDDEFWARGHVPGRAYYPFGLMCEAAAQLCCYYARSANLTTHQLLGFAAIDDVKYNGPVFPNSRLVIVGQIKRVRINTMIVWRFQEFVDDKLICSGTIRGVPLAFDLPS